MAGRFCSAANTVFFKALPLAVEETPNRRVIDSKPAPAKLPLQAPQRHIGIVLHALKQPSLVFARDTAPPVSTHLARSHASGLPLPPRPLNDARYAYIKRLGHRLCGQGMRVDLCLPDHVFHLPLSRIRRLYQSTTQRAIRK